MGATAGALVNRCPGRGLVGAEADAGSGAGPSVGPGEVTVTLRVNGTAREVSVEPRVTLLDALRDRLELTGTKKGCDRGECGA